MVAPPRSEAGKGKLGCLFALAVLVGAVYVGKDVGAVYWRSYQMQDEVKSQAGFAPALTDQVILERLVAMADTLGVPLGPRDWHIKRTYSPKEITIRGEYDDSVVFSLLRWRKVLRFHFTPSARADL
jgi:hypothetical protein